MEWALHRGQDNTYTIGTSHSKTGVATYQILSGNSELPVASVHSHPNSDTSYYNEKFEMGYLGGTIPNDYYFVSEGKSPKYNYVYYPSSRRLYNVELYDPRFIKNISKSYKSFMFGTLNHK